MPATALDSAVFRDIFATEAMRARVLRRGPRAVLSRHRGGAGARAGAARHHPADAAEEIVRHCHAARVRHGAAEDADRAHRLSGAAGGAAARRLCSGRARRMVPLGRHDAGHHRHRDGAADPRRARAGRGRISTRSANRSPVSRKRYRDTPMAGRSNLQQAVPITFGYKMAVLLAGLRPPSRSALNELRPRVLVGEFGGAAGNLSSLGARRARGAGRR